MPFFQAMLDKEGKFAGFIKADTTSRLVFKVARCKDYTKIGKIIRANDNIKGRKK